MNKIRPLEESSVKKAISERDERVIAAYDAQGSNPDIPALAVSLGLTPKQIRYALSHNGIKPISNGKRGRKPVTGNTAFSLLHARIAQILREIHANYELETGSNPRVTIIASEIGITKQAYIEILAGQRDVRLSELQAIAKAAKKPLAEIVGIE